MSKTLYTPRIWQSVFMLAIYQFVLYLIPLVLLSSIFQTKGYSSDDLSVQILATICGFVLLVFWLSRKNRLDLGYFFRVDFFKLKYLFPISISVLGADILVSELGNRMQAYLPMSEIPGKDFQILFHSETSLGKSFLLVVIIAPILEELVFRGLILRGFLDHYSIKKSVMVSALLFGVFHMNPWQFPGAFVWGIMAGWWYIATGSLLYCILGHILLNGIGFILVVLNNQYGIIIPGFSSGYDQLLFQPIWLTIMGLISLIIGILTLAKMFREDTIPIRH